MKTNLFAKFSILATLFIFAIVIAGCKTSPPIDWNSRIGNYTYEQAVAELGQPDKVFKIDGGKTVARWITLQSNGSGINLGSGYVHESTPLGATPNTGPTINQSVLQLTFGSDGKLLSSMKVY